MTDKAVFMLEMSVGDLAFIYQIARRDKKTVNEWIMGCIMEKLEKLQEEWLAAQKLVSPSNPKEEEKRGEK